MGNKREQTFHSVTRPYPSAYRKEMMGEFLAALLPVCVWDSAVPFRRPLTGETSQNSFWCVGNWLAYLLTYYMKHSPSWEAGRFSASQGIPHILWNPKVAGYLSVFRVRLMQFMSPHPTSWRYILILLSHLRLRLPSGPFLLSLPTPWPSSVLVQCIFGSSVVSSRKPPDRSCRYWYMKVTPLGASPHSNFSAYYIRH